MLLLRAVIYCRCSTEEESQVDALRKQVLESEACVQEQGWFLIDRYVESKSGTTTKGRAEYNRLFEDLLLDKFDVIVIKSQDRLMRNVKDWYLFLDRMLSHGKRLFMYLDRKFYTTDDALITGIKAILAEEYSRELSKKINNAHHNRQINGGKAMLTSRVYGFEKLSDGTMKVVEQEAEIIRKIYEYCAAGYGSRTIANILLNRGCKKRTGTAINAGFIGKMIRSPLYKGILVMNRKHYDFETKRLIQTPKEEWIYGKNIVPAIVSEELWERANTAMTDRAERFSRNGINKKGNSVGKYDLSGKIVCGQCQKPYYRTWRHGFANPDDVIVEWKCCTYLEKGRKLHNRRDKLRRVTKEFEDGCDSIHVEEKTIYSMLEKVCVQYFDMKSQDKENIINHAVRILEKALSEKKSESDWVKLEKEEKKFIRQKELLLTKLLDEVISDSDYQQKNHSIENKIQEIRKKKELRKQQEWEVKRLEQRIEKIREWLIEGGVEQATVSQMLQDVRKIVVYEWHIEIILGPLKIMGLKEEREIERNSNNGFCVNDFKISMDYPFSPTTERGRYLDREKIIEIMKETPDTSAKKIALQIERPVKMVQSRIKELRKEGRIRFNGSGGHGVWEVLCDSSCRRSLPRPY